MTKIHQTVTIVSSSDPTLSSMSKPSRLAVKSILSQHFTDVNIKLVDNLTDLNDLVASQPDLVFLGMKYLPHNPKLGLNDLEKIWLSDYLESHGITCTGSPSEAHDLEINKPQAKQQVAVSGFKTARYFTVDKSGTADISPEHGLSYPLFIKPTNRGGGLGVDAESVVTNYSQLVSKVEQIARVHQSDSLVEEFLPGREFSVAILRKTDNLQYKVMPIELSVDPDDNGVAILAGDVKSENNERISTVDDFELADKICRLALGAFKSIGGRDYGRIDIRLDSTGEPTFLEANLIPSLIDEYGSFPKSCAINANMAHSEMILKIVRLAMIRQAQPEARSVDLLLRAHAV